MDVRGAFKDRHQKIGEGHIGTASFEELFAHESTVGVPLVLETPGSREPGDFQLPLLKRLRSGAVHGSAPALVRASADDG
jgi:deoxyribonuclease-4